MNNIELTETSNVVTISEVKNFVNIENESDGFIVITSNQNVIVINSYSQNVVNVTEQKTVVNLLNENNNEVIEIFTVGAQGPSAPEYIGPEFTYDGDGLLTRIDYDDGSYKLLTYSDDKLDQIDFYIFGGATIRKSFNYSGDTLASIDQTTL